MRGFFNSLLGFVYVFRRTFVRTPGEGCERALPNSGLGALSENARLGKCSEDGYRESEIKDHCIERARSIIAAGCKELQVGLEEELVAKPRAIGERRCRPNLCRAKSIVRFDWIRQTLNMGDRSSCCQLTRQTRHQNGVSGDESANRSLICQ
jgi:hypothetical protein